MRIHVETCESNRGMKMPRNICFNGNRIEVVETLDQWPGPDYCYVKVKGDDGNLYILRFNEVPDEWELIMFESIRGHELLARAGKPPYRGDSG